MLAYSHLCSTGSVNYKLFKLYNNNERYFDVGMKPFLKL